MPAQGEWQWARSQQRKGRDVLRAPESGLHGWVVAMKWHLMLRMDGHVRLDLILPSSCPQTSAICPTQPLGAAGERTRPPMDGEAGPG